MTVLLLCLLQAAGPPADDPMAFFKKYCVECHRAPKPKGDLDLSAFDPATGNFDLLNDLYNALKPGEMLPKKAKLRPTPAQVHDMTEALTTLLIRRGAPPGCTRWSEEWLGRASNHGKLRDVDE